MLLRDYSADRDYSSDHHHKVLSCNSLTPEADPSLTGHGRRMLWDKHCQGYTMRLRRWSPTAMPREISERFLEDRTLSDDLDSVKWLINFLRLSVKIPKNMTSETQIRNSYVLFVHTWVHKYYLDILNQWRRIDSFAYFILNMFQDALETVEGFVSLSSFIITFTQFIPRVWEHRVHLDRLCMYRWRCKKKN